MTIFLWFQHRWKNIDLNTQPPLSQPRQLKHANQKKPIKVFQYSSPNKKASLATLDQDEGEM